MGRIPTPLYNLLTAHCSIDVTSGIGDKEGVGSPVPGVCICIRFVFAIGFVGDIPGNMDLTGTHSYLSEFLFYWCSKFLVFDPNKAYMWY